MLKQDCLFQIALVAFILQIVITVDNLANLDFPSRHDWRKGGFALWHIAERIELECLVLKSANCISHIL